MDDLADRYADRGVTSVFIYTREAHPAEHYRHHQTFADKRHHARAFRDHCSVRRPILLDDIDGSAHRGFGLLPNMTYIIGRNLVLYRAAWTDALDVEDALQQILQALPQRRALRPFFSERIAWRPLLNDDFRAGLERNGPQAISDFYGKG